MCKITIKPIMNYFTREQIEELIIMSKLIYHNIVNEDDVTSEQARSMLFLIGLRIGVELEKGGLIDEQSTD